MSTLVEKLKEKENEIKEVIDDGEERLITEYGKIFDEYEHHPLVWRVMSGKTTFERDIEENLVKRYKSRFRKYIFDRADSNFSGTLSMYKDIYPSLDLFHPENYNSIRRLQTLAIIINLGTTSYLMGLFKGYEINSILEEARYLDSAAEKVKKKH